MIKVLILLYISLLLSCNSNGMKINEVDSLQVINTFNCYLDNATELFANFQKNRDKVIDLKIEFIFYNSDSTKMFVIAFLEYSDKRNLCVENDSSTFYFYPFVGYRDDIESKWEIRYYNTHLLIDGCNRRYLREIIQDDFIENFKNTKIFSYSNNKYKKQEVGYNINEDGFWESPFWEKGGLIEDKYFFEVEITSYVSKIFKPIDEIKCESSP